MNNVAAVPEGGGGGHGQAGLTRERTGTGRCILQVLEVVPGVRLDGVRGVVVVRDAVEEVKQVIGRWLERPVGAVMGHTRIITDGSVGRDGAVPIPVRLPLLDSIRVPRGGPGRPRKPPDHLIADEAYSHPSTRRALRRRGIAHSIPEKRDQRAHRRTRGSAGGRPPAFDRDRYKQRNVVERCFNRLKQFRALATRYAKRAVYYRATLLLVSAVLWLRA